MNLTRRGVFLGCACCAAASLVSGTGFFAEPTLAAEPSAPEKRRDTPIILKEVQVFDGIDADLRPANVMIADRKIGAVSPGEITHPEGATVIEGGGRVLMPGLTDAHWHMVFAPNTIQSFEAADTGLLYANAVAEARRTLMRGFTSVRDVGGPTFGLKQAIDSGSIPGPRVFPSGALISQTAGHGDFGPAYERPVELGGRPSRFEQVEAFTVANGVSEVEAAVRLQLKRGASQIKIAVTGGVISDSDPLDTLQFTPSEIRAAVQTAADWGTYVAAHDYTGPGIRRAVEAGVRSVEHGHLADEEAIRLMADRGAWLSIQPFEVGDNPLTPAQIQKAAPTMHWDRVCAWAKQYGVKTAVGTDMLFQPDGTARQAVMLTRFAKVFGAVNCLRMLTSGNADLFAMSGNRNPYKEAKLGVVQPGAWADLLLLDGNPIENIDLLHDYERNIRVIIKDGVIHKNTLRPT